MPCRLLQRAMSSSPYWTLQRGGNITVSIDYALQNTDVALRDVVITVPLGSDNDPKVCSIDIYLVSLTDVWLLSRSCPLMEHINTTQEKTS